MKRPLCLLLTLLLCLSACGVGTSPSPAGTDGILAAPLAAPVYPDMAPYPDESRFYTGPGGQFDDEAFSLAWDAWRADQRALWGGGTEDLSALTPYFTRSMEALLSPGGGENRVCSPVSVYMALAMLAETTGGSSREQLLALLGAEDLESLRSQAGALWNGCYCADGATTSVLAGSLWLGEELPAAQPVLDTLAETYRAFSYRGEMGSEALNGALRTWLSQQTGGLLDGQLDSVATDPQTLLALVTTVYFQAKWATPFQESRNEEGLFSTLSSEGERVPCTFLRRKSAMDYYWGENFSAVSLPFEQVGRMWFLLPDEGSSLSALLSEGEAARFLLADGEWAQSKRLQVDLSAPKFDVSSQLELTSALQSLGVRDIFDLGAADFSPLTDQALAVTQILHGARVRVDETGCEAAAYTSIQLAGSAMPPEEEIDFVLDRPFLFAVTSQNGLPLFIGVVSRPA